MTSKPQHPFLRPTLAATALLTALAMTGCVSGPRLVTSDPPPIPKGGPAIPSANKVVLAPGTQVVADTAAGPIKIEAGPGSRRVFDWDGLRRGAITKPRDKSFAGGDFKGISFDGKPKVWAPAKGITKLHYEEGRRDFDNVDDAMIWMQIRRLYFTYNDAGLVIGWKRQGDTLHVELWQFYIDGSKPTSLPNSDDKDITVGPLKAKPQKMHPHLVFADGHTEPYNTNTASQYKGATASKCNWFKRLFGQCTATPAESTASTADNGTAAEMSTASAASGASPASSNPPATSGAAGASTANENAPSPAQKRAPQATIAGKVVNIRARPSTHSDVLLQAKQDDSVAILKKDRGWRYVKFDDGRKGWVADFLLKH